MIFLQTALHGEFMGACHCMDARDFICPCKFLVLREISAVATVVCETVASETVRGQCGLLLKWEPINKASWRYFEIV